MVVMWLCFAVALTFLVLGVRSFLQKGFLLNNAYIYASKEQRETMNKKPYYRQSAVVFWLISMVFAFNGTALALQKDALFAGAHVTLAVTLVYAVVSSVIPERRKGDNDNGER